MPRIRKMTLLNAMDMARYNSILIISIYLNKCKL